MKSTRAVTQQQADNMRESAVNALSTVDGIDRDLAQYIVNCIVGAALLEVAATKLQVTEQFMADPDAFSARYKGV